MAEKSKFRKSLNRLFSNSVIVRTEKSGKGLRIVDTQRIQSHGNLNSSRYVDRFNKLYKGQRPTNYGGSHLNYQAARPRLYNDYESMDMEPITSTALDIYADESTMPDVDNKMVQVVSDNKEIKTILENLLNDILNVDFNLWPWVRTLAKYGDFFLYLDVLPKIGIVNVQPISVYDLEREENYDEKNPFAVRFVRGVESLVTGYSNYTSKRSENNYLEPWQVGHFRLLGDPNFLPHGRSMLEPARQLFKQMKLMEDAMMISRIMRSPEKRVFKINVGNIPPSEVDTYMQKVIDQSKKVPYMDEETGEYNLKYNMMNITEDFYLPVRGQDQTTEIDTLPGLEYDGIQDVEYLQGKLFAALKIPKAYLGYEGDINAKATLASEDVRFARTIQRIQETIISELTKLCYIHLYCQGFTGQDLIAFDLSMQTPSLIYEQERLSVLQSKVDLARDIKDSGVRSIEYILKEIFKLSDEDARIERLQILRDAKERYTSQNLEAEGRVTPEEPEEDEEAPLDSNDSTPKDSEDDVKENRGRPKRGTQYRSTKHVRGGNPIGAKKDHTTEERIENKYELLIEGLNKRFGKDHVKKGKK